MIRVLRNVSNSSPLLINVLISHAKRALERFNSLNLKYTYWMILHLTPGSSIRIKGLTKHAVPLVLTRIELLLSAHEGDRVRFGISVPQCGD